MNIDTIPDIEVIEHLDFDAELGCESFFHGKSDRHSGDSAEFMQIGPCAHATGLRCATYVRGARERIAGEPQHTASCHFCGYSILASDLVFAPVTNIN